MFDNLFKIKVPEIKKTDLDANYFERAGSWADDLYTAAVAERNRWKAIALYVLLPLVFILLMCVLTLVPTQHLSPILINHYEDGQVIATPIKNSNNPIDKQEIESDIVRYIVNRESYSAQSYQERFNIVNLLSSDSVASQYNKIQSAADKSSPINVLGDKGTRKVHIDSVLFMDSAKKNNPKKHISGHRNLAQVDYVVTETNQIGNSKKIPYTALVSWKYTGAPSDPEKAWTNWNGFTITDFENTQKNINFE